MSWVSVTYRDENGEWLGRSGPGDVVIDAVERLDFSEIENGIHGFNTKAETFKIEDAGLFVVDYVDKIIIDAQEFNRVEVPEGYTYVTVGKNEKALNEALEVWNVRV